MLRFKKSSKVSEIDEKSPPVNETLDQSMTNNDVTFLYGRPYAEQPRALAYYYEDEDDYDMKTMYINDGFEQGMYRI